MSKIIFILFVLAVVASLLVAVDPESRARAVETWEQVKAAWADFSKDFSASMSTLMADFRERFGETGSASGTAKEGRAPAKENSETSANFDVAAFLKNLWMSISSGLNPAG